MFEPTAALYLFDRVVIPRAALRKVGFCEKGALRSCTGLVSSVFRLHHKVDSGMWHVDADEMLKAAELDQPSQREREEDQRRRQCMEPHFAGDVGGGQAALRTQGEERHMETASGRPPSATTSICGKYETSCTAIQKMTWS